MNKGIRALGRFLAAACCAAALLSTAHGASVIPLYLDEMIDTAAGAFEGRVLENRTERDAATGFVVTYTTFEVREALKGHVGARHTIKQVGGVIERDLEFQVPGVPRFKEGADYVVFLAGVSSKGFSSPIGLSQGRFGVITEEGVRKVANGRDFRDMTARMANVPGAARAKLQQADPVRKMDLVDFKQLVRGRVGGAR